MGAGRPSRDARTAWLGLAVTSGLSPRRAFELVARFGTPEAVLDAAPGALSDSDLREGWERGRREAERLARLGATFIAWSDPAYPARLREIADPPLTLAVRGALVDDEPTVAIVGTRRASE